MSCEPNEHKYIHVDTKKSYDTSGWQTLYKRVDIFFCEKCLHDVEKVKSEYSRERPDWY